MCDELFVCCCLLVVGWLLFCIVRWFVIVDCCLWLFVVCCLFVCLRVLFVGGSLLCVLSCLVFVVRCVVEYCSLFEVNSVSVIYCCLQSC